VQTIYFGVTSLIPDEQGSMHDAQSASNELNGQDVIHVDEDFLSQATTAALGGLLAHEAFHRLGYAPHPGESYPYTSWPYSVQDQCVDGT